MTSAEAVPDQLLPPVCQKHAYAMRTSGRGHGTPFCCSPVSTAYPQRKGLEAAERKRFLAVVKILSCTHKACDSTFITALQSLNYVFMVPVWDLKALLTRLFH